MGWEVVFYLRHGQSRIGSRIDCRDFEPVAAALKLPLVRWSTDRPQSGGDVP